MTEEITTNKYRPTLKRVCECKECPAYGKPLVDRGLGYPCCPTIGMVPYPQPMNQIHLKGDKNHDGI